MFYYFLENFIQYFLMIFIPLHKLLFFFSWNFPFDIFRLWLNCRRGGLLDLDIFTHPAHMYLFPSERCTSHDWRVKSGATPNRDLISEFQKERAFVGSGRNKWNWAFHFLNVMLKIIFRLASKVINRFRHAIFIAICHRALLSFVSFGGHCLFVARGNEPRALQTLGKCSLSESIPVGGSDFFFLIVGFIASSSHSLQLERQEFQPCL